MRFMWKSAVKDIRRMLRDPAGLGISIGIPVIVAILLFAVFGSGQPAPPHGVLIIADQDHSLISMFVSGAFQNGPMSQIFRTGTSSAEAGMKRLNDNEASALLVIPPGFGRAFLSGKPAALKLTVNPAERIMPRIAEQSVSILTDAAFYLQQAIGQELRAFAGSSGKSASPGLSIMEASAQLNKIGPEIGRYLNPPVISVETEIQAPPKQTSASFAAAFFPGFLLMAVLFFAEHQAVDVWKEKENGTLRRLFTTSGRPAAFLTGKMLSVGLAFLAAGAAAMAAGYWMLHMPVANPVGAVLWLMLSGVAIFLIFFLLSTFATTRRTAGMLSNMIMMPLAMVGGCFFPFEAMPAGLAAIGKKTPNGFAIETLKPLLRGGGDPRAIALAVGITILVTALLLTLAVRRLHGRFAAA